MIGDIILLKPTVNDSNSTHLSAFKVKEGLIQCQIGLNTLQEINEDAFKHFSYKIAEVVDQDYLFSYKSKYNKYMESILTMILFSTRLT